MSRSFREPWIKDPANRYMKAIHARRVRRGVKQILGVLKRDPQNWDIGPVIDDPRIVTNSYDICDYIFWGSNPKWRRK